MKTRLFESGYPCFEIESDAKALNHKIIKIGDSADKMPNKKLPPPLRIEDCLSKRTQKDAADIKPTPKRLTFDDLETAPKAPIRTRQGDSMTTSVTKKVTTPVYIPFFNDYPQHQFAPLPEDSLQVLHPGAKLIECPEELKMGMNALKPIPISGDPNQILECRGYR